MDWQYLNTLRAPKQKKFKKLYKNYLKITT